ncbi:MAG: PKD domain-containing protein, partial [bacterium]
MQNKTLGHPRALQEGISMFLKRCAVISLVASLIMFVGGMIAAQEISPDSIENYLEHFQDLLPPPVEDVPSVLDTDTPLLPSPTGDILVRTMPSSFNELTGKDEPYAWPGRNFPIWGSVTGGTPPYTYEWDFGVASPSAAGSVANANYIYEYHAYSTVGIFYARLNVTDNVWDSDTSTVRIRVDSDSQEVRVRAAIGDGLRYLYLHQGVDGRWSSSNFPGTVTAAVVACFEIHGHFPTNDPESDIYAERVQLGLDYVFTHLDPYSIYSHGPCGDPDLNGNNTGIAHDEYYGGKLTAYSQGIIMLAIASSYCPDCITTTGPSGVFGRTYKNILTDMVDQLAFSQTDGGSQRGGWRYEVRYSSYGSDNSAVQWASIGLRAAEAPPWDITVRDCYKNELGIWTAYSQCWDGCFGYV